MTSTRRYGENRITAFMESRSPMGANTIHSDEGAQAHGFQSALVVGGNVYGWTVPAILQALGERWLSDGWVSLNFRRPTYVGDEMTARVVERDDGVCEVTMQKQGDETVIYGEAGLGKAPWLDELAMPARLEPEPRPAEREGLFLESPPIGQDLRPMAAEITKEEAIRFATETLADTNPLWRGETPIVHPGWINGRMSPLMLYSYSYNPSIIVHCRMQHLRPFYAGQKLSVAGQFREAFERRDNHYWVVDGMIRGEDGEPLVRMRQSNIFRVVKR
jgi:acyl dehydratase